MLVGTKNDEFDQICKTFKQNDIQLQIARKKQETGVNNLFNISFNDHTLEEHRQILSHLDQEYEFLHQITCSALTGENIKNVFDIPI